MSNKQSSVEWFIEQLEEKGDAWENVSIRRVKISIDVSEYLELKRQAKEMHKEEVTSFTADWSIQYKYENGKNINKYYKETFGGQNEQ